MDLQLAAEPGADRRYLQPVRRLHHGHLVLLLRQAAPDADADLLAHTLMGYLNPGLIHHLTRQCGMPPARLEAGWSDLVDRVTGC
jgi:hypothetical protein